MKTIKTSGAILSTAILVGALAGCSGDAAVSYSRDVQPILQANCMSCHQEGGAGQQASGFSMATYADLMKGTSGGPMIIPGDAEGSNLLVLMEGRADPSISMPHGRNEPVGKSDIDTIRRWIEQGAKKN